MIKEFIIRLEDPTTRQQAKLQKVCKAIAEEYRGEYYLKTINLKYKAWNVKLAKKPLPKDRSVFWERIVDN